MAGIEGLVAEDQRRDAAGHAARVDDQDHRRVQQAGEGGVAVAAVQVEAVVQALVALDQAHAGAACATREAAQYLVVALQVEIQVVTGRPAASVSHIGSM
jgi:hypothetical protein